MCQAERGVDERVEALDGQGRASLAQRASHQAQMQRAHDLAVLLRHLTEGAVVEGDHVLGVVDRRRVEAYFCQHRVQTAQPLGRVDLLPRSRTLGEVAAPCLSCLLGRHRGLRERVADQAGQHLGQQPVAALAGRHVRRRGDVHHPRPPWAALTFRPPFGQSRVDESVEVEPGGVGVQPHPRGDLLDAGGTVDGPEDVQHPPATLTEHRGRRVREWLVGHGFILPICLVDTTEPDRSVRGQPVSGLVT
jgi:hypothetical protein